MKKFIVILVLFVIAVALFADTNSAKEKFAEGAKLYKQGQYLSAAKCFDEILDNGYSSAEVFYNLGNCYFKSGNLAKSILNYERAKRLAPDDEDIEFNLNVAQLKSVDKIEPLPRVFVLQWWDNVQSSYSSATWGVFAIIFLWSCLGSVLLFFVSWHPTFKKMFFVTSILSFVILIFSYTFAIRQSDYENTHNEAVIFHQTAYVKSSPDITGTDLFILHEGTKVRILDAVGEWRKIRLANGNIGWIQEKTIVVI